MNLYRWCKPPCFAVLKKLTAVLRLLARAIKQLLS